MQVIQLDQTSHHPNGRAHGRARFMFIFLLGLFSLLLAQPRAQAASSSLRIPGGGQVLVDAKYASRDYDKGTLELSGDVIIMYSQQYMSCDRAMINEKTHVVEASGHVIISSPQAYVEGSSAVMNYSNNTGVIQNGFVKSGQVIFQGSVVRKTGNITYEAENSFYTACTTCPAAWTFNGTRMAAEIGGYAYIKNPIMRIANFPVLWLPYLVVPLKSQRQTGFLVPSLEYSGEDGAGLGLRFFWAISRNQDATFTTKYYTRRGLKGLVDYRYVLSPTSQGELNAAILRDQIFPTETDVPVGGKGTRWFLQYNHSYDLPYDVTQKTNLNVMSDLFYSRDFANEVGPRGDPALENKVSATRNTDGTHSSIEADYFVNTLKSNPIDSNVDAVHKWPEIRYAIVDHPVMNTHLLFSFNANYTNFARDDYGYDSVAQGVAPNMPNLGILCPGTGATIPAGYDPGYAKQVDVLRNNMGLDPCGIAHPIKDNAGGFDPSNDIVRTAQRLDLAPQISYPFTIGKVVDILPSLTYRHTQYAFGVSAPTTLPDGTMAMSYDTTPYRAYTFARVSARSHFYRTYTGDETKDETKADHPSIGDQGGAVSPVTNWVDSESRSFEEEKTTIKAPAKPSLYRHEMVPEIVATYLPSINQPGNHPFFSQGAQLPMFLQDEPISNDNFLSPATAGTVAGQASTPSNIQFDYYDRITTQTTASAFLTNRLVRKRYHDNGSDYLQIASWKLGGSYDFTEASRQDAPSLPIGDFSSNLDMQFDRFAMNSLVRYFPYHQVTDSFSYIRFKNESGSNFIQASFSRIYNITRFVQDTTKDPDTLAFSTGVTSKFVDATGSLNFNPSQYWPLTLDNYVLSSWSTDFRIRPPGNCWVFKVHYDQQFAGPHTIGFDFEYNFGGAPG